jgi:hypothetical protein
MSDDGIPVLTARYAPAVMSSQPSIAAADAILPHLAHLESLVLRALQRFPVGIGATDQELQRLCRLSGDTERPRRVRLVELGLVEDSGQTRRGASGRKATVWTVTQRGRDA